MASKDQIVATAIKLLQDQPHGLRYTQLHAAIRSVLPDANPNSVGGAIWNLEVPVPDQVYTPARGMYIHTKFKEAGGPAGQLVPATPVGKPKIKEEQFYEPFADWLVKELEECTKAISVGGNLFKDKWGTPDVVGVREPKKSDIVKLPTEIVSAEVKIDSAGLITAFGQACAYRLFSHKSYIVVPVDSNEDDISRLDALARIFGIGLILFDATDPKDPKFEIRVRAAKLEPDMFYVNRCMKFVEDLLFN
jgi:hypothetical protein